MRFSRKLASIGAVLFCSMSVPVVIAEEARAGTTSQPILNSEGQLTGGSVFLSCESGTDESPGATVVTYQLNAAPTAPFVSVGPLFFVFTRSGLIGPIRPPVTREVPQRSFNFESVVTESIRVNNTRLSSVELRGGAQGLGPDQPTAGINYRLGDVLGTGRPEDKLTVRCD